MSMELKVEFDREKDGRHIVELSGPVNAVVYGATQEEAVANAIAAVVEDVASIVARASVTDPSPLDGIGSLKLSQMNETARTAIHAACQVMAFEIRSLVSP